MKSAQLRFALLIGWSLLISIAPSIAQSNTILALQADSASMETGQYYPVSVYLQDVNEVWQINAEIEYDPNLVYVIGTIAGSPMSSGDFFGDEPAIMIRNDVTTGQITFTHSLVAPATPKSGSGIVATFQIYPLAAGTTQIRFSAADLTKVNFTESGDGSRTVESTEELPVLPALIELNIAGETVEPPDESTPTPAASETPDVVGRGEDATVEPTLINITLAAPDTMPTLIPQLEDDDGSGTLPTLPIAIGLLVVGILGGIILLVMSRRQ